MYVVQYKRRLGWQDYTTETHLQAVSMAKDYDQRRVRGFHWRCVHRTDAVVWEPDNGIS